MGEGAPARGRLLPIHDITPLTARPGIQYYGVIPCFFSDSFSHRLQAVLGQPVKLKANRFKRF